MAKAYWPISYQELIGEMRRAESDFKTRRYRTAEEAIAELERLKRKRYIEYLREAGNCEEQEAVAVLEEYERSGGQDFFALLMGLKDDARRRLRAELAEAEAEANTGYEGEPLDEVIDELLTDLKDEDDFRKAPQKTDEVMGKPNNKILDHETIMKRFMDRAGRRKKD